MSWHHGNCKGCSRISDSELCARCEAGMDHLEEHPRRELVSVSTVRIPYDPENDPF